MTVEQQATLTAGVLMHARTQDDTQLSALMHLGARPSPHCSPWGTALIRTVGSS